ncbi:hypothetical protein SUGI_0051220 [Cryptomeria japonica]|nr:hypothetical protein SUGI_0051220 [Cryptomeria japonica]
MALTSNPPEESVKISFGVYKPTDGHDIDDAVAHLRSLISLAERAADLKAIILKSVNGSWVAVFCVSSVSQTRTVDDEVIRVVDWGSFQKITEEQKANFNKGKLSVGDIVSVRRIYTDLNNQELIAYSCLAVLKSFFAQIEGLNSSAFYKSKDGKLIMGLGIWDSAEFASALLDSPNGSPGEAYWKDLGATNLKFEICQVVYISKENSPLPQTLDSTDQQIRTV